MQSSTELRDFISNNANLSQLFQRGPTGFGRNFVLISCIPCYHLVILLHKCCDEKGVAECGLERCEERGIEFQPPQTSTSQLAGLLILITAAGAGRTLFNKGIQKKKRDAVTPKNGWTGRSSEQRISSFEGRLRVKFPI